MKKRIVHTTLGSLLLLLFVGYYANTTLFIHTHEYNNKRYTHSHFPCEKHTHSIETLEWLAQIAATCFLTVDPIILDTPLYVEIGQTHIITTTHAVAQQRIYNPLRAPPTRA